MMPDNGYLQSIYNYTLKLTHAKLNYDITGKNDDEILSATQTTSQSIITK